MSTAIPHRLLPPIRYQQRWPELADLENNPFFLLWLIKTRHGKKYRNIVTSRFWKFAALLIFVLFYMIIPQFTPYIHPATAILPALLLLGIAVFVNINVGINYFDQKARLRLIGHHYGIKTPNMLYSLCLTPIDHKQTIMGLIAPRLSRSVFTKHAFLFTIVVALDIYVLTYFSFPAVHYILHLGALISYAHIHLHYHDAIMIFSERKKFEKAAVSKNYYLGDKYYEQYFYDGSLIVALIFLTPLILISALALILNIDLPTFMGEKGHQLCSAVLLAIIPIILLNSRTHFKHAEDNLEAAAICSRRLLQEVVENSSNVK